VINCKNNTTDKVYFFNATILPNFDEIKDKLVVCKNPRICHIHFEFKWLNLKLKKGAFPTFFERSDNVYNNNPAAAITPDQHYAPTIPDHEYVTEEKEAAGHKAVLAHNLLLCHDPAIVFTSCLQVRSTTPPPPLKRSLY